MKVEERSTDNLSYVLSLCTKFLLKSNSFTIFPPLVVLCYFLEAAKKTTDKSMNILTNIERWQKGVASNDIFGVPLEITVQRQHSLRPIPNILVWCADHLVKSGLHTEYLFKAEGDRKVVLQLISVYNRDSNAPLPDGIKAAGIVALIKCYLACLPDPLVAYDLYDEIRDARSSINDMREILKKLPNASYMTLEFMAFLLQVSRKYSVNKVFKCAWTLSVSGNYS